MRFIPTKIHGILDYTVGLLLIVLPWILNFDKEGPQTWVPVTLGVAAILYSLFTNYELGLLRRLSMRIHLTLDILSGIILASSPWVFNFDQHVYVPHLLLGIFEIIAGLLTKRKPTLQSILHHL